MSVWQARTLPTVTIGCSILRTKPCELCLFAPARDDPSDGCPDSEDEFRLGSAFMKVTCLEVQREQRVRTKWSRCSESPTSYNSSIMLPIA